MSTKQTKTTKAPAENIGNAPATGENEETIKIAELGLTEYRKEQQERGLQACVDSDFINLAKQVHDRETFIEFFAIASARGVADALVCARTLYTFRESGVWKQYSESKTKTFTNFKSFAKKYAGIGHSTLANYMKIGALITDDFHSIFKHLDGSDFRYTQLLALCAIEELFDKDGKPVKVEPVFRVKVNGKPVFDEDGIAMVSTNDSDFDNENHTEDEERAHYAQVTIVQNLVTKGYIRKEDTPDKIAEIVTLELIALGLKKRETPKAPAEDKPAEDKPAEDKPAEDKPAEDKPAEDKPAEDKEKGIDTVSISLPRHVWKAVSEFIADTEEIDLQAFQSALEKALKA